MSKDMSKEGVNNPLPFFLWRDGDEKNNMGRMSEGDL